MVLGHGARGHGCIGSAGQSGQATLLLLGVLGALLVGTLILFGFGQALGARGKHQRAADLAAAAAHREAGPFLSVTSGFRSDAEQARLFAAKRTVICLPLCSAEFRRRGAWDVGQWMLPRLTREGESR